MRSMWCYHPCRLHIQWDVSLHRVEACSWPTTIQRRCDESSIVSELCLWNCIKVIPIVPTFPDCNEHAIRIPISKEAETLCSMNGGSQTLESMQYNSIDRR